MSRYGRRVRVVAVADFDYQQLTLHPAPQGELAVAGNHGEPMSNGVLQQSEQETTGHGAVLEPRHHIERRPDPGTKTSADDAQIFVRQLDFPTQRIELPARPFDAVAQQGRELRNQVT